MLTEASQNALAAEYHQRAVDIDLATLGSSHPDAVLRLAHLAAALFRVGRPQEGAGFFDRAIQIVHTLTFDGTDMIMAQLGDVLKKCQQLQAADNLYAAALERVLMKVDTAAGEAPPHAYYSVLTKRANLAKETGHYADAAGMYEQVLRVQQAELGEEHPMVSSTLSLLGLALSALGQHSAAVVHHRRSLAISERTKSADDPDVTRSLGNLGAALLQAGQQAEGIGYLQRAADASEGTSDVAGLAKRLGNLAMAVEDKEPVRALELYSRALDLTRTVHGDSHPDTSTALGNLATSMVGTGQLKEALPLFEQALQVDKAVYGEEHPAVATVSTENTAFAHRLQLARTAASGSAAPRRTTPRLSEAPPHRTVDDPLHRTCTISGTSNLRWTAPRSERLRTSALRWPSGRRSSRQITPKPRAREIGLESARASHVGEREPRRERQPMR